MSVVFYHGNCYDGFTAAWVARRALGKGAGSVPVSYGDPFPIELARGEDAYILDFFPGVADVMKLCGIAKRVVILDHHKTAEADYQGVEGLGAQNLHVEFDMRRSGAGMAWDHFNPLDKRPLWIDLVEDRDLWRFHHGSDTRNFHAYLASWPMEFSTWDMISEKAPLDMIRKGHSIRRYINVAVSKQLHDAREDEFEGHRAVILNHHYQNCSEAAHEMLANWPEAEVSVTWYMRADGRIAFSLRSRENGPDVSELAKRHGGGGHEHAAGFIADELGGVFG